MPNIQYQILITQNDDGTVEVKGPIENRLVCYGLLAIAADAVREHLARNQSRIIQPSLVPPTDIRS